MSLRVVCNGAGQFSIDVLDTGVVSTAGNVKRLGNTRCLAHVADKWLIHKVHLKK